MNVFISGGCKNGKSLYAQRLALAMALAEDPGDIVFTGADDPSEHRAKATGLRRPLYYIATMIPKDEEDRVRIEKHLQARDGWGFTTVEVGTGLLSILDREPVTISGRVPGLADTADPVATDKTIDPRGAFLLDSVTALLSNEMFRADGTYDSGAGERLSDELVEFAGRTGNTVFVSDYIYSDAREYDHMTENYRRALALCDRRLAEVCDRCVEVSYGTITEFK